MRRYHRRHNSYSNGSAVRIVVFLFLISIVIAVAKAILNFLVANLWILIVAAVIAILWLLGYIFYKKINEKCKNFVLNHSVAIKRLSQINDRYRFETVPNLDMRNSYDNENFYADISPVDYLTYQLIYQKNIVLQAMASAERNEKMHLVYTKEVEEIREFDTYDMQIFPLFRWFGKGMEQLHFRHRIQKPVTHLAVNVELVLTNINNAYKHSKSRVFQAYEIKNIIERLSDKKGDFFTDENVWQSICRVERGKVSNKMRFAVYERDGNRCRRCGSAYNLEVDHIFPISKGGKSNFDNLQTLCHVCNVRKSNTVEFGAENPRAKYQGNKENCALCGAPLILKKGKYGTFYGCSNYPKCNFTKKVN